MYIILSQDYINLDSTKIVFIWINLVKANPFISIKSSIVEIQNCHDVIKESF